MSILYFTRNLTKLGYFHRFLTLPQFSVLPLKSSHANCLSRFSIPDECNERRLIHTCSVNWTLKIYTRTGDKGNTATFAGDRRVKNDMIFEALGTIDELTSCIGIVREFCENSEKSEELKIQLFKIQCVLQDLAACVATPKSQARVIHLERTAFSEKHVKVLETWIDEHTKQLPELKNFIIPSGGKSSSHLHLARAICRRAERNVVPILKANEVDEKVFIYLNRLSDYLFTIARVASKLENKIEEIYTKP